MKARVKATGETIDVEKYVDGIYISTDSDCDVYAADDLDFWLNEPSSFDYWARLEHQYAGMAMQGLISDSATLIELGNTKGVSVEEVTAKCAIEFAHALVEKLKSENNGKKFRNYNEKAEV